MKTNYKIKLRNALRELSEVKMIENDEIDLTKSQNKELWANKYTYNQIKKAITLIPTDFDKALGILCDIPYYHVTAGKNLKEARARKPGYYNTVGSNELYSFTDTVRHYIRMLDLEDGNEIGKSSIWNSVTVLTG